MARYSGIAWHQSKCHDQMIELMNTGTLDFLQVNHSPLETEADQRVHSYRMRPRAADMTSPFFRLSVSHIFLLDTGGVLL